MSRALAFLLAAAPLLAGCSTTPPPSEPPSEASHVVLRYGTAPTEPGANEALARELEDRLARVPGLEEMRSVCTRRGIHLSVRVRGGPEHEEAMAKVRGIAARFEAEHPELERIPEKEKEGGK